LKNNEGQVINDHVIQLEQVDKWKRNNTKRKHHGQKTLQKHKQDEILVFSLEHVLSKQKTYKIFTKCHVTKKIVLYLLLYVVCAPCLYTIYMNEQQVQNTISHAVLLFVYSTTFCYWILYCIVTSI